jgi:hypothetical protein
VGRVHKNTRVRSMLNTHTHTHPPPHTRVRHNSSVWRMNYGKVYKTPEKHTSRHAGYDTALQCKILLLLWAQAWAAVEALPTTTCWCWCCCPLDHNTPKQALPLHPQPCSTVLLPVAAAVWCLHQCRNQPRAPTRAQPAQVLDRLRSCTATSCLC